MKGKNTLKFLLVIFITTILTFLSFKGLNIPSMNTRILSVAEGTRFGIDINGGVRVILSAPQGVRPSDKDMDAVVSVLNKRLDSKQILDRTIVPEKTMGRVIVEIPWKSGETKFNAQEAVSELGRTAKLTFYELDNDGKKVGEPLVTGAEVDNASPEPDQKNGGMHVKLDFKSEGAKKFEIATERLVGKKIGIFLDNDLISAPVVNEKITGGNGVITMGSADANSSVIEAKNLADTINAGALPFNLEEREVKSITPNLGQNALNVILKAGAVALMLVWIFMLAYYRLPGILANIALLLHTVIQVLFITWTEITLTLPGIAGIILTIGMGVDANVIIFERIKEELRSGKTLRAAIEVGFKKAFSAILDANVTTLISGLVLFWFGTGPIKSFAITLMLGVFLSFFTAITASRILLKSVSDINIAKHRWLYGVK
jgi:preprotein translocase subunit SecD